MTTQQPATLWPTGITPDQWVDWFLNLDGPNRYDVATAVLGTWGKAYATGWHDGLEQLTQTLEQTWAGETTALDLLSRDPKEAGPC